MHLRLPPRSLNKRRYTLRTEEMTRLDHIPSESLGLCLPDRHRLLPRQ